jgi:endonuclease/exonuclease/phosphatase family metal-dependent hydrolase
VHQECSGEEVILMGDFNEVIEVHSHSMSNACRELDLTDAIHYFHGLPEAPFSTWIDGK